MTDKTRRKRESVRDEERAARGPVEPGLLWLCRIFLVSIGLLAATAGVTWIVHAVQAQKRSLEPDQAAKDDASGKTGKGNSSTKTEENAPSKQEIETRLAAAEKENREHIDKELEHAKTLLDGLVTLVGVYSALLGVTAFVTVKFSRDDAKEQVQDIRATIEKELGGFQKSLEEVTLSFPEFKQMGERMRSILHEIELRMPPRENWFQDGWFERLHDDDHTQIQSSEMTIAAISIFALERAPRIKPSLESIYYEFALYYTGRSLSQYQQKGDFARALMYAKRVIDLSPDSSTGYRLQGAVCLERYWRLPAPSSAEEIANKNSLLTTAQLALDEAVKENTTVPVDAAAYYNRALLAIYQNDTGTAIKVSENLLKQRDKVPDPDVDRYLPDIYRNLACFYADLAAAAKQDADRQSYSAKAVETLKQGLKDFEANKTLYRGLQSLKKSIGKELEPAGDLAKLDQWYTRQIKQLVDAKPKP